jgi:geranylgeranyl diphosphate synthase type I
MRVDNEYHNAINRSVQELILQLMKRTGLSEKLPKLCSLLSEYCLHDGKRIRSTLFALAYLEQRETPCKNLFIGAASLELLHLFALIQDDIIDNSVTRRGKHSLHKIIEGSEHIHLKKAQDLAVIFSDILYSAAIEAFMQIDEKAEKKETALKIILDAAVHTGSGQFLELIYSSRNLEEITLQNIYEIYDLKTARYTFCGPMTAGAMLAGCDTSQIKIINQVGLYLGRAYQISDDIIDFSKESTVTGIPSDIVEQRKTILMWHLNKYGAPEAKVAMKEVDRDCTGSSVSKLVEMFNKYGSFEFAIQEMNSLYEKSLDLLSLCISSSGSSEIRDFVVDLFCMTKREQCL